ncbi:molybdopterin molybdotransferase MoeA [Mucilaginibacter ginsenosidivorans]|uniref:Molybdopterin molybdenumtransferase n=1 Tax=Mucilaginibacter ginsenosidivorans TaxID=398053 RepID=A0A5B8V196_9SPHI|nr:molybdopterin molybdotransferase MoeA [Mucilaginibacter ginsenosidivorans]QEC64411.1 molybdopterin molybdotransferase MoeA [Mucilaginibacter ginsenosidivorans]
MTTVEQAEKLILAEARDFGTENIPFEQALGRALAEDIKADRDLPPFNRVTMDGIAISYKAIESHITAFKIKATQAAGDEPVDIESLDECIEIMTGAALPNTVDTIIPYEHIEIKNSVATILNAAVKKSQNLHFKGADKQKGQIVATAGQVVSPAIISVAASVGKAELLVRKMLRIVVVSSGDELVDIDVQPLPIQIRKSNSYTIRAVLSQNQQHADLLHIPDDPEITGEKIGYCLQNYDVVLMTGGISMGKFDYIPRALEEMQVKTIFHKVSQRPGKPFWFGKHENGVLVFAFPGNPVATFMCLHRYFLPWLRVTQGLKAKSSVYAVLDEDFTFKPELQYFLQVTLRFSEEGKLFATPVEGNGSGDFANLADTDAFMELPLQRSEFKKSEAFRVWPFNNI